MSWIGRAEALADTEDLGQEAAIMGARCRATGLAFTSFRSILGAARALGSGQLVGDGWLPYRDDHELVGVICDMLDEIADRWQAYVRLRNEAATARARAWAYLEVVVEEADRVTLRARIADCTAALEVLSVLAGRLTAASRRLNAAPVELGDTYAAVYQLVAAGRVMPHNGRWITGQELPA